MTTKQHALYYAHDPMCSWCWGFKPAWSKLQASLPDSVETHYVLGGLAPDTTEPMPEDMQQGLQQIWQRIAATIPGTQFNHDFWTNNQPRRATYPACRAVIAATAQNAKFEEAMITAIQQAYYLNAQNPSDDDILINLATDIGCDTEKFKSALNSLTTIQTLNEHLSMARKLGAHGFPSLFFSANGSPPTPIALNYSDNNAVLEQVHKMIAT